MSNLISCVMCTYRRFTCVERSIKFFLNQDYSGDLELIIYNTDIDHPLELSKYLKNRNITIVNNNTDYFTDKPYDNIGAIRRDSLEHAKGKYYICWDDDDIFLPWNVRQCFDGITNNPDCWSWKPYRSMFWKTDHDPQLAGNVMEASIISRIDKIKEFGFHSHQGGGEHLAWENNFQKYKKILIDKNSIPGYCFNWSDQGKMRGHKQSGTIDRPDNFQHHKSKTTDYAQRPLAAFNENIIKEIYDKHINVLKKYTDQQLEKKHGYYTIQSSLVDKYVNNELRKP